MKNSSKQNKSVKAPKSVVVDHDNPFFPRMEVQIQIGNPDLEAAMSGAAAQFFPSSGNPLDR